MDSNRSDQTSADVETHIHLIRGKRVVLDRSLARLYGVTTYRLNEQVRRNHQRFPEDFMFQLTNQEVNELRSQIAISKSGRGGTRYLPFAFTEHGAVMAATVLSSPIAVEASILIVRAFIRLREILFEHADLKRRLQDMEIKLAKGFAAHEHELQEIISLWWGAPVLTHSQEFPLVGGTCFNAPQETTFPIIR